MASTFSPSLKLELIGNGDQSGTWGTTTNTNLGTLLEQAITGVQAITMVNANYTLSDLNGVSDEARNAVLVVGGTNSAIRSIIAPSVNKTYIIANNTVGGFAIIIKTSAGTGLSIANGATQTVYCDGSEFYAASFPSTGGAITGNLSVSGTLNVTGATTLSNLTASSAVATNASKVLVSVANSGTGDNVLTSGATLSSPTINSPTLTAPALGTPSSGVLTNTTGLPLTTGVTGTLPVLNGGTGVTTSTGSGSNVLNTSPTLVTPILGTPASGVMTNVTGLPLTTGVTGTLPVLNGGTGVTTSTGTGNVVLSTSPTLITPALGTPSALVGTNITGTAAGLTAGTVTTNANLTGEVTSVGNAATVPNATVIGKVLTGYTSGAGTVAATDTILQAIQKLNGNNATNANLTGPITSVGNATSVASQTGTGSTFVMNTSPTLVTPLLGTPTSGTLTNCTGLPISTGVSGLATGAATFLTTPSSANLAAMLTDETGTGAIVFANSPTLVTPALGTPSALVGTNITGTAAGLSIGGNAATATSATSATSATTAAGLSATLVVGSGGTGITSAGTNGNVLTSNGSAWVSSAPASTGFDSGTRMPFNQTSAPTGWTKDTTAAINDAILRLVTGTVSSGGSTAFSTWNANGSTGAYTLAMADIASHTHAVGGVLQGSGNAGAGSGIATGAFITGNTNSTGGGNSHSHSLSKNIKYYDFIIASKD